MRKNFITMLLLLVFLFGIGSSLQAAYLKNIPLTLMQPNGDTLHCFVSGDEFYNYLHDINDYTIIQNINTGFYVYAQKVSGEVVPSQYIANSVDPETIGLIPGVKISPESWMARREAFNTQTPAKSVSSTSTANRGNLNNLVVFIRFSGEPNLTTGYSSVVNMFNDSTLQANSMYNYFKSTSYNQLFVTTSFYPAPSGNTILSYEDTYERGYYMPYSATNTIGYSDSERTSREHALLKRAINYVASSIPSSLNIDYDNDGYVDNVCFVVKGDVGAWNNLLWPHRWSLYSHNVYVNSKRVYDYNFVLEGSPSYFANRVLCHEMQHTLSYPDFYHYDENTLSPVGIWDVMESTANPPQHSGAYAKLKYGHWIDSIPLITTPGTYTLNPLGISSTGNAYRINGEIPGQFFVLEYRNTSHYFESALPGSGLVIYRINQAYDGNASYNGITQFDEVYVFRPNGTTTVNGTVSNAYFSSQSGRTSFNSSTNPRPFYTDGTYGTIGITDITSAGSTISFTFNGFQPTINPSTTSMNLTGYLPSGAQSQSLAVLGGSLTDSITVFTALPFQVSLNNNTWVTSLKLPQSGGTLYVKYSSLVAGTHTGTISLTSGLALPVSISLTGKICDVISTFPFIEGFEGGEIPSCWTQEYSSGEVNWIFQNGGYNGLSGANRPPNAHTGTKNALFYHDSFNGNKTKLITPALDISQLYTPQLTFWRANPNWNSDIDNLKVYYKTYASANWILLNSYTTSVISWTLTTINLPNPSATYFIAFEGIAKYGYGVSLDDISITGISGPFQITASAGANGTISPSGNVSVNAGSSQTFTFTPNAGCIVDSVFVDESYMGRINSYSFNNVIANHTIRVVFKTANSAIIVSPNTFDFQAVMPNPSVSYSFEVVAVDLSYPIVITAPNHYEVSLNNTVWQNNVTLPMNANQSVFVRFHPSITGTINDSIALTSAQIVAYVQIHGVSTATTFTILAMSNAGGNISPEGHILVEEGDDQTFTFTADTGFELASLYVNDELVTIQNPYTFSNVSNGHTIYAYFVNPSEIDALDLEQNIELYPNPVHATLFIRNVTQQVTHVQLFDITGRLLSENTMTNDLLELDLSRYSQGVYLVKFITDEGVCTKKLFKY